MKEDVGRLVQEFLGGLLMAAGVILVVLSGLCTVAGMLFSPGMALAVGSIPILLGAGMWVSGSAIYKAARPPPRPVLPPANFSEDLADGPP